MNWTVVGAISALISVGAGAFGAHGLRNYLSAEMLHVFEVGVRYQMFHALAMLAVGALATRIGPARGAGWCFLIGTLLFSGSLYGLSLTGARFFGPITPIGGVFFMVGWGWLAWAAAASGRA